MFPCWLMIRVKRVYDTPSKADGARFLVERLWPRGIKKSALQMDGWARDAAPTTELRKWFAHLPARWTAFRDRYFAELEHQPGAWAPLVETARKGNLTLLFSSRETEHNNAVALKAYLEAKLARAPKHAKGSPGRTHAVEKEAAAATRR
jgi:uncharacterized protein YeaO (DUF488 family)